MFARPVVGGLAMIRLPVVVFPAWRHNVRLARFFRWHSTRLVIVRFVWWHDALCTVVFSLVGHVLLLCETSESSITGPSREAVLYSTQIPVLPLSLYWVLVQQAYVSVCSHYLASSSCSLVNPTLFCLSFVSALQVRINSLQGFD